MMFASALFAFASAGGILATYLYEDDAPFGWRVSSGSATGLVALGLVGLLVSMIAGLGPPALVVSAFAVGSPLGLLLKPSYREAAKRDLTVAFQKIAAALTSRPRTFGSGVVLLTLCLVVLGKVNDRVVFERTDGLYTGVTNNLGDLPFHLAVVSRFLYEGNLPPENPIYASTQFAYPFLADFVTAMFAAAGADLRSSMLLVNLVLMCALVVLAHRLTAQLTSDRGAALLMPVLLLLNGGFGWWLLVQETQGDANSVLGAISRLSHDYTIRPEGNWRWGNIVTAQLLPQRGFLLGLPLSILIFTLWDRAFPGGGADPSTVGAARTRRRMVAAGVIAGVLPLAHTYSYAVVMAMAGCFALASRRLRVWVPFFTMSLALGVPQVVWLAGAGPGDAARFVGWHLGWDHGTDSPLWFWLKNTGALIPLVLVAMLWRGRRAPVPARLVRLYLPFIACFLVPNVVRLAPWIWDNMKVLVYWHVASMPLVALVLVRLWRGSRVHRVAAAALVILLTAAGALDLWRVVSHAAEHRVFTREGMVFADLVRDTVPPDSLVLHAPTYNHPVFLAGRRSLMGYPGHLWSHGVDYRARQGDIERIYAGDPDAPRLLERYGVAYIVVGPLERDLLNVNDAFVARFPAAGRVGLYTLLQVASSSD